MNTPFKGFKTSLILNALYWSEVPSRENPLCMLRHGFDLAFLKHKSLVLFCFIYTGWETMSYPWFHLHYTPVKQPKRSIFQPFSYAAFVPLHANAALILRLDFNSKKPPTHNALVEHYTLPNRESGTKSGSSTHWFLYCIVQKWSE